MGKKSDARDVQIKRVSAQAIGLAAVLHSAIKHLAPEERDEKRKVLNAIRSDALKILDRMSRGDAEILAAAAEVITLAAPES